MPYSGFKRLCITKDFLKKNRLLDWNPTIVQERARDFCFQGSTINSIQTELTRALALQGQCYIENYNDIPRINNFIQRVSQSFPISREELEHCYSQLPNSIGISIFQGIFMSLTDSKREQICPLGTMLEHICQGAFGFDNTSERPFAENIFEMEQKIYFRSIRSVGSLTPLTFLATGAPDPNSHQKFKSICGFIISESIYNPRKKEFQLEKVEYIGEQNFINLALISIQNARPNLGQLLEFLQRPPLSKDDVMNIVRDCIFYGKICDFYPIELVGMQMELPKINRTVLVHAGLMVGGAGGGPASDSGIVDEIRPLLSTQEREERIARDSDMKNAIAEALGGLEQHIMDNLYDALLKEIYRLEHEVSHDFGVDRWSHLVKKEDKSGWKKAQLIRRACSKIPLICQINLERPIERGAMLVGLASHALSISRGFKKPWGKARAYNNVLIVAESLGISEQLIKSYV